MGSNLDNTRLSCRVSLIDCAIIRLISVQCFACNSRYNGRANDRETEIGMSAHRRGSVDPPHRTVNDALTRAHSHCATRDQRPRAGRERGAFSLEFRARVMTIGGAGEGV